jgi:hypothetical protein
MVYLFRCRCERDEDKIEAADVLYLQVPAYMSCMPPATCHGGIAKSVSEMGHGSKPRHAECPVHCNGWQT